MFDYFDFKDAMKAQFNYLSPGRAPYYFIIISAEIMLYKTAHELKGEYFAAAFAFGAILFVVCALFSMWEKVDNDSETEQAQIRVARIIGISAPVVALAISMTKIKNAEFLMTLAILVTAFQSMVFMFLVKEKYSDISRSVNIPQLLIVCSSLLFAMHFVSASLSGRVYVSSLPESMVMRQHGEDSVRYERNRIVQSIRDESSSLAIIAPNSLLADYSMNPATKKGFGVSEYEYLLAKRQKENLIKVLELFFVVWAVTILRTVYYAYTKK